MPVREDPITLKPRDPLKTFLRFLVYLTPHWHMMLLVIILNLIAVPLRVIPMLMTRFVIDNIFLNVAAPVDNRIVMFLIVTVGMNAMSVFRSMMFGGWFDGTGMTNFFMAYMDIKIRLKLRCDFYTHLQRLPLAFHQSRPIGEHLYRVMHDTGGAWGGDAVSLATQVVPQVFGIVNTTIIAVTWMALIIPELASVVIVYIILRTTFQHVIVTRIQRSSFIIRHRQQYVTATLRESIAGALSTKAMGRNKWEAQRYIRTLFWAMRQHIILYWWNVLNGNVLTVMGVLFNVGVFAYLGHQTVMGEITIGEMIVFSTMVHQIGAPIIEAVNMIQGIRIKLVMAERILQTIDVPLENVDKENPVRMRNLTGRIELDHVKFDYPDGTKVLEDVNLTVEPGESVAIVGPSGQGKTTLLYLILRMYETTGGAVRVDGVNVNDLRIGDVQKQSGMVLQDTHLFIGSIGENICYRDPLAGEEAMMEAARVADAHDFVTDFPDGYDTDVQEGFRLSGGQRQRIGIARALVGDPRILLFDEPTSNLDPRTEADIWGAMKAAMTGRTSLIVTHRLPTARQADRIAVLNEGVIAEIGSHDELMARDSIYARMWRQQFHGAEAGD